MTAAALTGNAPAAAARGAPLLAIRNLKTYYGNVVALKGVDLDVHDGEIVTLIGANGAGKSTLMMSIFGNPRAREGSIGLDELTGGTFTITNGGVFGSLVSTPILNPPQSAILGMHKIQDRPVVVNGQIVVRPMMYIALSYDHRIIDGREAVLFLVSVKESLEDPARLLLQL